MQLANYDSSATARRLHEAGTRVVVSDLDEAKDRLDGALRFTPKGAR